MCESSDWKADSVGPVLRDREVHVWRVPLERTALELRQLRGTLSTDETVRADRFYFQRDRDAFVAARGTLRQLLGRYLGRSPGDVAFDYGPYGKPNLIHDSSAAPIPIPIQFNVSHSHGLALMAFSLQRRLGVDVESIRPEIASDEIAARYFSPREVAELRSLPPAMRSEGFFLCWTRKEAYVKAIGDGLQISLNSFHVGLTPSEPERLESSDSQRWTLRSLRPGAGFAAAIVAEGKDWELRCWDFVPPRDL
jgi:4'-phosphopantetheinyl transferase